MWDEDDVGDTPGWNLLTWRKKSGKESFDLQSVLTEFSKSKSSEPLDRVYALLGFAEYAIRGEYPLEQNYEKKPSMCSPT